MNQTWILFKIFHSADIWMQEDFPFAEFCLYFYFTFWASVEVICKGIGGAFKTRAASCHCLESWALWTSTSFLTFVSGSMVLSLNKFK